MSWFFNNNFVKTILSFRPFLNSSTLSNPVVTVREGKLRGVVKHLTDGSEYYSFKGIPYATPPVGKLRFKGPLPPKPWNGILDAAEHGPVCPQHQMLTREIVEGSENCLYLNVYTRSLEPQSKIPVMVFIHGGGFLSGSGDTDIHGPEFLLLHDVILVTINYRLEAFGFLCLDIPEAPGNAGLKDQVAALKWVRSNITQFGGDPDNITIFGESAGGASVTYQMISSMSKGLFHKAITQSGTFFSGWAFQTDAKERAFRLGRHLGKDTNDPYDLLEFLQSVPPNKLIGATSKVATKDEKFRELPMYFCPVVEKEFPDTEAFLTTDPLDLMLSGKFQKVPLMAGYNSAEGLIFALPELRNLDKKSKSPSYFLPNQIYSRVSEEKAAVFGHRLKEFYFSGKEITQDNIGVLAKFLADRNIVYDVHRFVNFYAQFHGPIYMYRFDLVSELNFIKTLLGLEDQKGACHADDLYYLFKNEINIHKYEEQQKLRDHVYMTTKLWTDFAKTGNPTPDNELNTKWRPYTKTNKEYLCIDETLSMEKVAEKESIDFWNKLHIETGLPSICKSSL